MSPGISMPDEVVAVQNTFSCNECHTSEGAEQNSAAVRALTSLKMISPWSAHRASYFLQRPVFSKSFVPCNSEKLLSIPQSP